MKRLTGVTVILAGIGAVAGIFGMSEAGAALRRRRGGRVLARDRWSWSRRGGRRGRAAPDRLDLSGRRPDRPRASSARASAEPEPEPHRTGVSRTTIGGRADLVGHPVRAGHAHGQPVERARVPRRRGGPRTRRRRCCRRRRQRRVAGRSSASRRSKRFALATRGPRPEVDDQPAAVVGQVVRRRARGRPSRSPPRPRPGPPTRSSAWRTWKATDGPLRSTNSQAGRPRTPGTRVARMLGRLERGVVTGTERGDQALGRAPPRGEGAGLQAVVAEIADATDPDPACDVRRRPTGQDRDREARSGRSAAIPRQPAQGAAGQRHDDGGGRIARALGQRAVEVGHDEQAARSVRIEARQRRGASMAATAGSRRDVDARQDRPQAARP